MKFSVVVPAYNYAHFLPGCLASVQAQAGVDWECLVIDDGSTDDTAAVVRAQCSGDERFTYLHQENQGLSPTRNRGIEASRAEWVAFLDADDQYYPEALQTLARATEQPGTVMVAGRTSLQRTSKRWQSVHPIPRAATRVAGFLEPVLTAYPSTVAVRKDVLEEIGGFPVKDGRDRYPAIEDRAAWIQVAARGGLTIANQVTTWYRRGHPESLQTTGQLDGRVLAGATRLYADLLEDEAVPTLLGDEAETFLRLCRAHLFNAQAVQALGEQRFREAGALWDEGLALCRTEVERQALVSALCFLTPGPRTDAVTRLALRVRSLQAVYRNSPRREARRLMRRALAECSARLSLLKTAEGSPGAAGKAALRAWLEYPSARLAFTLARRTAAIIRRGRVRPKKPDPPFG